MADFIVPLTSKHTDELIAHFKHLNAEIARLGTGKSTSTSSRLLLGELHNRRQAVIAELKHRARRSAETRRMLDAHGIQLL